MDQPLGRTKLPAYHCLGMHHVPISARRFSYRPRRVSIPNFRAILPRLLRGLGRKVSNVLAQRAKAYKYPSISASAIWTVFNAAPLRKLSATTHMLRPYGTVESSRSRLTNTSNSPTLSIGVT